MSNQITIYRGSHQIGGCATEIRTNDHRIVIDFGANLPDCKTQGIIDDSIPNTAKKGLPRVKSIKSYFPAKKLEEFGDIHVTPFIVDHSALDAYMFLIEIEEKKILFPRATSQVAACRHLATAARVKYPDALHRYLLDAPYACIGVFDLREIFVSMALLGKIIRSKRWCGHTSVKLIF